MANKVDKEIVYKEQITGLLNLLLEIAANDVKHTKDFEEEYRKRLNFQKQTGWKRFKASVDLLDDTEYAIMSAFQYQLGDLSKKNNDIGEMNLRLYEILNAVYLQMEAFKQLSNLLNYPHTKKSVNKFRELDIYKLRGIAGSHTVNYEYDEHTRNSNPKINKVTSFRIIQVHLEKTGSKIVVLDENDITFEFNLLKSLTEYEKNARALLIDLILYSIDTLIVKKEDQFELKSRLYERLSNLIDYTISNNNKDYQVRRMKEL